MLPGSAARAKPTLFRCCFLAGGRRARPAWPRRRRSLQRPS